MKRIVELVVDLQNKIYNTIFLKQMDTTIIKVKILNDNTIVDLTSQTIDIIFTKPNGTIIQQLASNIDIPNGIATIPLLEDCVRQSGKAKMEIEVKNTNSEVTSSFYIPVQIEQTSKAAVSPENTENYFEEFSKAIDDFVAESSQMLEDISSAEATRVTNENKRISAENTRKTNETNRTNAETARVEAEEERATAEQNRVTEFEAMMSNVNAQQVQQNKNDIINLKEILPKNAGSHNGKYRGKDITSLFYAGTLTTQIAAGTFDDIFIGDYIIGKVSGRKYLVADINYRLHCGDTECTRNHVLLVPERTMGNAQMNTSNITTGGYYGSAMYTTNLAAFKTIIQNDFGIGHILSHKELLTNAVTDGKASGWAWYDSTIELMNESMVYGHNVWGSHPGYETGIDKSQLSLFRLRPDLIPARDTSGGRTWYWLRDVVSSSAFARVADLGHAGSFSASHSAGVRPAFLIY